MQAEKIYQQLTSWIINAKPVAKTLIVGINGVDGSGKTFFAEVLAQSLRNAGHPVCSVSIDGFHHPKDRRYSRGSISPEGYYHDSIDFAAFADQCLKPVFEVTSYPARCQTKLLNLETDKQDIRVSDIDKDTILLVEGVFLFRPEMLPFLHVTIFLHADFETILDRVIDRDLPVLGNAENILQRYKQKYIPGQKLYIEDVNPAAKADIVIDNNDFLKPEIVSCQLQGVLIGQ